MSTYDKQFLTYNEETEADTLGALLAHPARVMSVQKALRRRPVNQRSFCCDSRIILFSSLWARLAIEFPSTVIKYISVQRGCGQ